MPLTQNELSKALYSAFLLVITFNKIDTLVFRKGALLDKNITQQKQLIKLSELYLNAHPVLKSIVKNHIDMSEMSSGLYHNPPHKFRGSYRKVVVKTFAGIMAATI